MQSITKRTRRRRPTVTQEPSAFSGYLKCPECGGNLNFHFNQGNHDIKFFSCQNHNSGLRKCSKTHYIRLEFLEQVVLYEVHRLAHFANEYEDEFLKAILADESLPHPPLEAVFTVDEEVGMEGAFALDCSDLKGRKLVNLDSEEEGIFTVSCAGGVRLDCSVPGERAPLEDETVYTVVLSGLLGGHSGADIHRGRASANQVMGRVLYSAMERIPGLRLTGIQGGRFDNVICSENRADMAVPRDLAGDFEDFIREFGSLLKNEYAGCDDGVALSCTPGEPADVALTQKATENLLRTLLAVPQGGQAMSADFPGLVQTSLNLGLMETGRTGSTLPFPSAPASPPRRP